MLPTKQPRRGRSSAPEYFCPAPDAALAYQGPTGFHWLVDGLLGGVPRPGIMRDTRRDVQGLERLGVKLLITLNRNWPVPVDLLGEYNIDSHLLKITDMEVPTLDEALGVCKLVDGYVAKQNACVFHCKAGRGRTGTMLTAQLIYYGMASDEAILTARARNPKWIESQMQIDFLHDFGRFCG